jgi:hypothetical protein
MNNMMEVRMDYQINAFNHFSMKNLILKQRK